MIAPLPLLRGRLAARDRTERVRKVLQEQLRPVHYERLGRVLENMVHRRCCRLRPLPDVGAPPRKSHLLVCLRLRPLLHARLVGTVLRRGEKEVVRVRGGEGGGGAGLLCGHAPF